MDSKNPFKKEIKKDSQKESLFLFLRYNLYMIKRKSKTKSSKYCFGFEEYKQIDLAQSMLLESETILKEFCVSGVNSCDLQLLTCKIQNAIKILEKYNMDNYEEK